MRRPSDRRFRHASRFNFGRPQFFTFAGLYSVCCTNQGRVAVPLFVQVSAIGVVIGFGVAITYASEEGLSRSL